MFRCLPLKPSPEMLEAGMKQIMKIDPLKTDPAQAAEWVWRSMYLIWAITHESERNLAADTIDELVAETGDQTTITTYSWAYISACLRNIQLEAQAQVLKRAPEQAKGTEGFTP